MFVDLRVLGYGSTIGTSTNFNVREMVQSLSVDSIGSEFTISNTGDSNGILRARSGSIKALKKSIPFAENMVQKYSRRAGDILYENRKNTIGRLIFSENGFRERLCMFWFDHFSVSGQNFNLRLLSTSYLQDAIRSNLEGPFENIVSSTMKHPAMIQYLNQKRSIGPNSRFGKKRSLDINENYARELLELHTMGVGGKYKQEDVKELAKLLTGIYSDENGYRFREELSEPGSKHILGKTYESDKGQLRCLSR